MRKGLFFLFLAIVSCKSKPQPLPPPDSSGGEGLVLTTATVNVAFAPGVIRFATPRIPAIAEELGKMEEVGVICIEELWTQESKDAVIKALGPGMYPFYIDTRGENQRDGENVCSPSEAKKAVSCAQSKCGDWPAEEQTICVFEQCRLELGKILFFGDAKCLNCLVTSVGKSVEGVISACVQPDNQPHIAGVSRAYDGQNGILLASRWPLQNKEVLFLRASFSNRVALLATIEPPGYEPIEVACSHISTGIDNVRPNHPDFFSWDEEMNTQIEAVSARLQERAGNRPQLFLGDMNAGPAIGEKISEEAPNVWQRIIDLGFYSAALQIADPIFCTICESNTLRIKLTDPNQRPAKGNTIIDHVLVRDPPGGMRLEPILAYPFFNQLRKFKGYNGELVEENLSDHYGVVVNFRLHKN